MNDHIRIDDFGWIWVDGAKVARAEPGKIIAFHDRCRRRVSQRGTDQVAVEMRELWEALALWDDEGAE